jgi:hypothetical protein
LWRTPGGIVDNLMEQHVSRMRDHVWAKRAFHLRYGHCSRVHADHFCDGFVAGYGDICHGGAGECPAVAPEKYWGFQYRSQEGAEMQTAWFAGFEAGAEAARLDGAASFQEIQVSHAIEQALLEEQRMIDQYAGIERSYIVDMAPVTAGSRPAPTEYPVMTGDAMLSPGTSQSLDPALSPTMSQPMANTPADVRQDNNPIQSRNNNQDQHHIVSPLLPATPASQPMPMQIIPAEPPVIPGSSQR